MINKIKNQAVWMGGLSLLAVLFIGLSLFHPKSVQAQTNFPALDISLSPPVVYLSIKPGETKQHAILIKNEGTDDVLANLSLSDFRSDNQTGQPILSEDTTFGYLKIRDGELNWKSNFLLKAKTEKKVVFDLTVPSSATEGEFPLTVLLNASRIGSNMGEQSQIAGMIGSNIIVFISRDETNQSKLTIDRTVIPKWVDSSRPLEFSISIKNTGKHAAPLSGTITIVNSLGQKVKSYLLYPDMVLANTSRLARAIDTTQSQITDIETVLAQPDLQFSSKISYQPLFLLGIYTIHIELPEEKITHTVVGLPVGLLLAAVVIPLLVVSVQYLIRKLQKSS